MQTECIQTRNCNALIINVATKLTVLILFVVSSFFAQAYRLSNEEAMVVNGIVSLCTYDINSLGNNTEIPETLEGQTATTRVKQNKRTVTDLTTSYRVLLSYTLTDNDVVVEDGVIKSCNYDFTASNIVIPDKLDGQEIIGIGSNAFKNRGITSIKLPSHLKFLGHGVLQENNLSDITIPSTIDSIADNAFFRNYIKNIVFDKNSVIRIIGNTAFADNTIDTLVIPKTIERIEGWAFNSSQINHLIFEEGSQLIFLGEGVFSSNNINHDITIPPLLKEIRKNAFRNNPIKHIYLNKVVTDIGEGAFWSSKTTPTIDPLPTPETTPFVTWFIRWQDSDNNALAPGYVITNFTKGYHALIDQYINVKIKVTDDNGIVLPGATIQFSDSLMTTNSLGIDSIAPVLRGIHNFSINANGCLSQTDSIDVQDNTYIQIVLKRLYTFNIKVLDNNNMPVPNVQIAIGDSLLQTNAQGEVSILLVNGNYASMGSLPGYSIGQADFTIQNADNNITILLNPATITYHPNGGAEIAYSEKAIGSTYQIKNNSFTKKGYSFTNWNTKSDGSGKSHYAGTSFTLEPGDLDLYAIWKLNTYHINYDLRGGQNDAANPATYTTNSNTIKLKPAIATTATEPYFDAWFDADGNKVETIPQGSTGDISLRASFMNEQSYLISYQNTMNGTHSNPSKYTRRDLPLSFLPAKQNEYNFIGWYSDNTFNQKIENLIVGSKGDTTLYAKWEPIGYSIQYVLNGGTNATQNPATYTIESNSITLQSASKEGYAFEGWFSDKDFSQAMETIPAGSTGNKTVYAKWSLKTYSIQYVLNGGINASQNPASYTIESSRITFQAATKQGFVFKGWFSDENFIQAIDIIATGSTGNKTIYAKWNSVHLLNFEITTDGSTPAPGISVIINNSNPLITNNNGLVQLIRENDFQFTYRILLDNSEITSGLGVIPNADQFVKVQIVNAYMRWYDMIFCDNGLQLWTAFEWQKSGQTIGKEQFYHNEGGIENGQYSLIVTSQGGQKFTWTKHYQNNLFALSFYPNPIQKSQELTINIDGLEDLKNCELLIYSPIGQLAHKITQVGSYNHVQLSSAIKEGIYWMVLTQNGIQLSSKQLIVR